MPLRLFLFASFTVFPSESLSETVKWLNLKATEISEGSFSVKVAFGFKNIWGVCYFRNTLHVHKCLWFFFTLSVSSHVFLGWKLNAKIPGFEIWLGKVYKLFKTCIMSFKIATKGLIFFSVSMQNFFSKKKKKKRELNLLNGSPYLEIPSINPTTLALEYRYFWCLSCHATVFLFFFFFF